MAPRSPRPARGSPTPSSGRGIPLGPGPPRLRPVTAETTPLDLQRLAARALVARVAFLLFDRGLTELQGGNMSVRVGDEVVTTPTMASERDGWRLSPDDMVIHDLDGGVRDGDPARVSRETRLHLRL